MVKSLAQGPTNSKLFGWDLIPGRLTPPPPNLYSSWLPELLLNKHLWAIDLSVQCCDFSWQNMVSAYGRDFRSKVVESFSVLPYFLSTIVRITTFALKNSTTPNPLSLAHSTLFIVLTL